MPLDFLLRNSISEFPASQPIYNSPVPIIKIYAATVLSLPDGFGKRHNQQLVKIQFIVFMIGPHAYADPDLIHTREKGAQDPVPEGKDGAVVGIPLFDFHGVVYAMHGGGHKENPP